MRRQWRAFFGALAVGFVLGGCGGDESATPTETRDADKVAGPSERNIESGPAPCAVGKPPHYFVPGPGDSPLALFGCARLGVSGKRVEFSGNLARIAGKLSVCINPAYSGRGQRGFYIPALCALDPPLSRFAIRDAAQPRQGVHGYAFVIWGTADTATSDVVARFNGGTARAAVFKVQPKLAREFGVPSFSLFVFELPLAAACAPVTVHADRSDDTDRSPPRPKLCARA